MKLRLWHLSQVVLLICVLCFFPKHVLGEDIYVKEEILLTQQIEKSLSYLYLDQAEQEIALLPNNARRLFYQANVVIYKFLCTYSPKYHKKLQLTWSETINSIEDLPNTDPLKNIMLAELYCKRAAIEFFEHNYFTAVRYLQSGRSLIRKNEDKFPGLIEHKKIQGLFNVAFGAVPRKYQWLSNFLGFKGDISAGVKELKQAAAQASLLPMEAEVMVYYVAKNMQDRPQQAIDRLLFLKQKMKDNMLLDVCLASGYINIKMNEPALKILIKRDNYHQDKRIFFIPVWDYLYAKAYYLKQDYSKSQYFFSKFLNSDSGALMKTDATFRLGMAYTLNNNYGKGAEIFKKMIADKNSGFDDDEYAGRMAQQFAQKEPSQTVKTLFKARNFYDGGYYEKALSTLSTLSPTNLNTADKTELHYRYARIFHTQGKLSQAQSEYQKCITQKVSSQLWLQVYSHYFLGEIAREQKQWEKAKTFYKKALTFNDYFYQDGLENRCKVALDELEERTGK